MMKRVFEKTRQFFHIFGAEKTANSVLFVISFVSSIAFSFTECFMLNFFAGLCALIAFALLVYLLKTMHCKQSILQRLAQDNRMNSIRLLLTYDYFRTVPYGIGDRFSCSKLSACQATYKYEIIPRKDGKYDLKCHFSFKLKENQKSDDFNILVIQPRGENQPSFKYSYDNENPHNGHSETIIFEEHSKADFSGILIGKIHTAENIKSLDVEFTLKGSYAIKEQSAILLYPSFYVRELDQCSVVFDYSHIDKKERPAIITLECAPYDGSKSQIERVLDLSCTKDRSIWSGTISGKKCKAGALYIFGIYTGENYL